MACCLVGTCSNQTSETEASFQYAEFPNYLQGARALWPRVISTPFPEPFRNVDAQQLHEELTRRTGVRADEFRTFEGFFAETLARLDQERLVSQLAEVGTDRFASGFSAEEALEWTRAYLMALRQERSTIRFWIVPEPRRNFDRLLEFDDLRLQSTEPLQVDVRGGRVLAWTVLARCTVADLSGRPSKLSCVFQLSGTSARRGLIAAQSAP